MTQSDLLYLLLAIGGVLAFSAVMIVGLVIMAVWLSRKVAKGEAAVVAAWNAFAQSLGLAVQPKGRHPPVLTGTYQGRAVRVTGRYGRESDSGSSTLTIYANFPADVYLRKSHNRILGVDYLPSGDADLDKRFIFQSRPPGLLARAVADPNLRRALSATDAGLTLQPNGAASTLSDVADDPAQLHAMLAQTMEAIDFVEREIGGTVPQSAPPAPEFYRDLNMSARIRLPRWAVLVILLVGALALLACMCAAMWPAVSQIWQT